ncbi:MAG: response regulator [Chitinivibrionales bacterium]|nr:response regulator [Chitinivibrionales bacterium]
MMVAIVDDDWGMLEVLTLILEKNGYTTKTFSDSEECWEWISNPSNKCPDILISDLMMPVFDGVELISKIRSETHCHNIPIILISSVTRVEDRDDLWDVFLHKSFRRKQFLETIDKAMAIRKNKCRKN